MAQIRYGVATVTNQRPGGATSQTSSQTGWVGGISTWPESAPHALRDRSSSFQAPVDTAILYVDAPSYTSSSTYTLTETRTATDATSGISSSSSTISDIHSVTFVDAPTGASSSVGAKTEQKTGADSPAGVSASAGSIGETRTGTDSPNGTSTAVATLLAATGFADLPSGASTSTGSPAEAYSPPGAVAPAADLSGLPALLELMKRHVPERENVYRDRPRGISYATHTLEERHTVGVVQRTKYTPPLPAHETRTVVRGRDVDIEELVILGLI